MANEPTTIQYDPDDRLHEAVAAYEAACDAGLNPTPQDWLSRYPEVAHCLAEHFTDHAAMTRLFAPLLPSAPVGTLPRPFASYELLEEIGRGAMGVVYKARQVRLCRSVALKVILAGTHAGPDEWARFRAEAEVVARLQHPNIVQVHDVGEFEGLPYLALEFCPGGNLAARLRGTPLLPAEAGRLVEQLARGVQAAHQAQVVHRDLKPANVLLAADGTPKVADFGLAKRLDGTAATVSGAIVGTPSYMAPEQAQGRSKEVGPACDVYALGAILYECLTGRPPFKAATTADTLLQVVRDEPAPVRRLQPSVPRDLETICLKCLAKRPEKRYADALAVAGDLRRFCNGEPITARRVGVIGRGAKWAKRRPGLAALATATVLATLFGVLGVLWQWRHAEDQRQQAEGQRAAAERTLARAEAGLYFHRIARAERDWLLGIDPSLVRRVLEECQAEHRHWEWGYLQRVVEGGIRTLRGHRGGVTSVAYSPDGHRLASASEDRTIAVWDAATGREVWRLVGHTEEVTALTFSPDGQRLASGSKDRTVRVWNASTGKALAVIPGHDGAVQSVAFSPNGRLLAAATGTRQNRFLTRREEYLAPRIGAENVSVVVSENPSSRGSYNLDLTNGIPEGGRHIDLGRGLPGVGASTIGLAASTWGQGPLLAGSPLARGSDNVPPRFANVMDTYVAVGGNVEVIVLASSRAPGPGEVKVWEIATGKEVLTVSDQRGSVLSVAFDPAGRWLVSAGSDGIARWDLATGRKALSYKGHTASVTSIAISSDGKLLASASMDRSVKVWEVRTGREVVTFRGHKHPVRAVAFSPDGKRVASTNPVSIELRDPDGNLVGHVITSNVYHRIPGTIKVWDAATGREISSLRGHTDPVTSLAFSPDGNHLVSGGLDRSVKVWDLTNDPGVRSLHGHGARVHVLAFSPDNRHLATGSYDHSVLIWETASGKLLHICRGHRATVGALAFGPKGRLASADEDGTVRFWDVQSGQEVGRLQAQRKATCLVFSADGKSVAVAGAEQRVSIWDTTRGMEVRTIALPSPKVRSLAFSGDGHRLAAAGEDGEITVWNTSTSKVTLTLAASKIPANSVAFQPNGDQLAAGHADGVVRLWDARSGRVTHLLLGHTEAVERVSFSSDGKRLASASRDRTVRIWDTTYGQDLLALRGHTDWVVSVAFSPDGAYLASGGADRTVRLWEGMPTR